MAVQLTEGITIGASLLQNFLPETAERIAKQLNTALRTDGHLEIHQDQQGLSVR